MKISYRWLREFVETELPPREIADRLINAGIEVTSVTPVAEGLSGVVVGQIDAIERDLGETSAGHHNRLCRVRLPDRALSIVCGAPNAVAGLKTAVAAPGATLPGGRAVKAARIRGVPSEGMLCSEKELGLGEDHRGILELPPEAPLGMDLRAYLGLDDWVLEIEITPNRPDALSVVGIAREIAALTGAPFRTPPTAVAEGREEIGRLAAVRIEAPDLCPRFCARLITGLTVRPSPPWLVQRLRAVGLRAINNLVDVTNYVMWEVGQPLHAFDFDTVAQHTIVVRRARPGERLTTLDGQDRALGPDMAMVCDVARALGVGGVMGGADSEVTERTTAVLLEAAYWDPAGIRRTSRALGLATDAAYRFERGGDIDGLGDALARAASLMAELGDGTVARGLLDVYPRPRTRSPLRLRLPRVERVVGACPPRADVIRILRGLGFAVDDAGSDLAVNVPSFRRDILQEDDLVEEVARIWGYDKIPLTLESASVLSPVTEPPGVRLARAVRAQLNAAGLAEAVTYAFTDPDRLAPMGWSDGGQLIALLNPLSRERSVLRPSMTPGLLEALVTNASHQITDVRTFEIGHVFLPHRAEDGDRPAHEELWLGIALTGRREPRGWDGGHASVDVYDAKGAAERALAAAGIAHADALPWSHGEEPRYLEAGRAARLVVGDRVVGWYGEVAQAVRRIYDLAAPVFVAELSLSALLDLPAPAPRYRPLPRYPAVERDLALLVPAEVTAAEIEGAVLEMRLPLLSRFALFDVYAGDQVRPGWRSLAWSLSFQAPDRTLRDAEVNVEFMRIVKMLGERLKVEVRGA
jgi:phenylalanyl-tRNA synthetase beta chain